MEFLPKKTKTKKKKKKKRKAKNSRRDEFLMDSLLAFDREVPSTRVDFPFIAIQVARSDCENIRSLP